MADRTPRVLGVVLVTWSPGDTLAAFLDSLPAAVGASDQDQDQDQHPDRDQDRDRDRHLHLDVVLADNGSTDGSVEAAAARPGVRLLRTGGNLGFGTAANRGVQIVDPRADLVLVANPDVVLHPDALRRLVAAADRHPGAGALGPAIMSGTGELYPSARRLPTLWLGVGHAVLGWVWSRNPWTRRYRAESEDVRERVAGWLSGSVLLLRRAAFERVGGFDERFFMYFEDVDLGERLGRAGWTSVYVPEAAVTHLGGHATARAGAAMVTAHHRSAYRYLAAHHRGLLQAPVRLALRAGLAVRSALAHSSARLAAGAKLDGRRLESAGGGTGEGPVEHTIEHRETP